MSKRKTSKKPEFPYEIQSKLSIAESTPVTAQVQRKAQRKSVPKHPVSLVKGVIAERTLADNTKQQLVVWYDGTQSWEEAVFKLSSENKK